MSALAEREVAPLPQRPGVLPRLPFGAHAALLLLVLVAVVVITNTGHVVNADEGAALSQAEILSRSAGADWAMVYPAAEIDPDGRWFPLDLSERVGDQWFPYTKKVAYPVLVSLGLGAGGMAGVLVMHAAAVWATAVVAALLARRDTSRPAADRWTLWIVGVGSALFFDSFWVIAHAFGALGSTVAVLGLVSVVQRRLWLGIGLVAVGLGFASLFRTEATLFGLAVAAAAVFWGVVWRKLPVIGAGLTAGAVTVLGYLAGAWLDRSVRNVDGVTPFRIAGDEGFVEARISGFFQSVLRPELGGAGWTSWLVIAVTGLLLVSMAGAIAGRARVAAWAGGLAVVIALVRLAAPAAMLPGLLIATPMLALSIWLFARRSPADRETRVVLTVCGLFAAAVLATQYAEGASGDWGGRYFHLALPAFIAVAVGPWLAATSDRSDGSGAQAYRWVAGSALAVSLVWAGLAVRTVDRVHHAEERVIETTAMVAAATQSADVDEGPVVVSPSKAYGRFAWAHVLDGRYLAVTDPADIELLDRRLTAAAVPDFVIVGDAAAIDEFSDGLDSYEATTSEPIDDSEFVVTVFVAR